MGKTALLNAIVPGTNAATKAIGRKDQRGRHTTSSAIVYELPGGGLIVDTPGVRELGMKLRADDLSWYFPEFEPLSPKCHFNDCTHTHEPDCAVRQAVEEGTVSPRRYESYLNLLASLEQT